MRQLLVQASSFSQVRKAHAPVREEWLIPAGQDPVGPQVLQCPALAGTSETALAPGPATAAAAAVGAAAAAELA